jgi:hypothetical protein
MMKGFFKKWLGLARMAEPLVLYRQTEHFGLNFVCLSDKHSQLQVAKWHILKTSLDNRARDLYHRRLDLDRKGEIGSGRRDSPCLSVERYDRQIELDEFSSSKGQSNKRGIGYKNKCLKNTTRRQNLVAAMKKDAEQARLIAASAYQMQTNWVAYGLRWDNLEHKDLTWNKLLNYPPNLIRFTLNAQSNTLPSPDNLRRWSKAMNVLCGLCGGREVTLAHILSGCSWVHTVEIKSGKGSRYSWRHDHCLQVLVNSFRSRIKLINASQIRGAQKKVPQINFVKEGQRPKSRATTEKHDANFQLAAARDWIIYSDLSSERQFLSRFIFPQDVAITSAKPDVVIISRSSKICLIWELTCPIEENIESWHTKKLQKYENEIRQNLTRGWTLHIFAGEIGAVGWIPPSFGTDLRRIFGFARSDLKSLLDACQLIARKCSYIIWLNRGNRDFEPWPLVQSGVGCVDQGDVNTAIVADTVTSFTASSESSVPEPARVGDAESDLVKAIEASNRDFEMYRAHEIRLANLCDTYGLCRRDILVRNNGNCGPDTLAYFNYVDESKSESEDTWLLHQDDLSSEMRNRLVEFLRDKEKMCIAGSTEVKFGQLPRLREESWTIFLDRMQSDREYFETPLLAASAALLGRKVLVFTSNPYDPVITFETLLGVREKPDILIGNLADRHFMPLIRVDANSTGSHGLFS